MSEEGEGLSNRELQEIQAEVNEEFKEEARAVRDRYLHGLALGLGVLLLLAALAWAVAAVGEGLLFEQLASFGQGSGGSKLGLQFREAEFAAQGVAYASLFALGGLFLTLELLKRLRSRAPGPAESPEPVAPAPAEPLPATSKAERFER